MPEGNQKSSHCKIRLKITFLYTTAFENLGYLIETLLSTRTPTPPSPPTLPQSPSLFIFNLDQFGNLLLCQDKRRAQGDAVSSQGGGSRRFFSWHCRKGESPCKSSCCGFHTAPFRGFPLAQQVTWLHQHVKAETSHQGRAQGLPVLQNHSEASRFSDARLTRRE